MYYFLLEKICLYEDISKKIDYNVEKLYWWGKDDFECEMDYFKENIKWSMCVYLYFIIWVLVCYG